MLSTNIEIETSFKENYERKVREPARDLFNRILFVVLFWLVAGVRGWFFLFGLVLVAIGVEKLVIWIAVRKLQAAKDDIAATVSAFEKSHVTQNGSHVNNR